MKRRAFITLLGGAAAAPACLWLRAARAQQPPKMLRVGAAAASLRSQFFWIAFERRMRELGYVEGQNLAVEFISVRDDRVDRLDAAMQELLRRKVDVIVGLGTEPLLKAAMKSTSSLPIIFVSTNYDPVAKGYVASISRPTGNVTGLYVRRPELIEKQMEILAETFSGKSRLGVLWDMESDDLIRTVERAAASLRLELRPLRLENPPYDFVAAFRTLAQSGAQMVLVLSGALFNEDRPHIAGLAMQHRLATMFAGRSYVEAGGLMSYAANLAVVYRRAADYVDRIAKGAKPADLPIEQPTKFELILNLKTAKALGLTLPAQLIARADEVIE